MELEVPSFVFTPGRNFRERTASGRLTLGFRRIQRGLSTSGIDPEVIASGIRESALEQLRRFYAVEVFQPHIHRGEKMNRMNPNLAPEQREELLRALKARFEK